jgi:hypothetical protein
MSTLSQFLGSQVETNFTTAALGDKVTVTTCEQSILICKAGGIAWVVSPLSAQVGRTWYCVQDAVTTAREGTSSFGWFVPTAAQLQNPGYTCRTYWSPCATTYWSSTEINAAYGCRVNFTSGNAVSSGKAATYCVRAFRQVTY